jgi:hypothetical protein
MQQLTMEQFWMGRDTTYASELTDEIQANGAETVKRANALLALYQTATSNEIGGVASGWRPAAVNASTAGAATHSNHMTGSAVDIADHSGNLKDWVASDDGQQALVDIGLWQEAPGSTPTWVHVQILAPHSGNRVFQP